MSNDLIGYWKVDNEATNKENKSLSLFDVDTIKSLSFFLVFTAKKELNLPMGNISFNYTNIEKNNKYSIYSKKYVLYGTAGVNGDRLDKTYQRS